MSAIDEVKSHIDIVDLVSEYVPLRRAGRNFRANCPFHSERTPSFHVSPDRQTWHCFGACATGGDVFSFVMKREGVEFGEALRVLAQRAGVTLAEHRREPQEDERRERLLQANELAAAFFHNALLNSKPAQAARSYLAERGLDADTIEKFELGYSLDSWDALRSHLTARGFTDEELLAAGLLVESPSRKDGGYDRFRGRLLLPIRDPSRKDGRVVGFGARLLDGSATDASGAKYINTPQTPMFDKGALLYALDRAKDAIRRQGSAIVVEGYMDVIAAHQHGIENVVASMGTALTQRQIRTLERLRCKILLAMDADAAGIEATLRALQEAGEAGAIRAAPESVHPDTLGEEAFSEKVQEWSRDALKRAAVNFFVVPLSGKDPDEMIRADRAAWDAAVASAKPFTDHVFDVVAGRKNLSQPAQRAELVRELLPVLRLIEEPVYQAHYLQRLARLAQTPEDGLRSELRRHAKRPPRREASMTAEPPGSHAIYREPQGEFVLALLLRHPELRPDGMALSPELFLLGEHRAIFAAWREAPDLESIRQSLAEELHPHLEQIIQRDLPFLEGTELHRALQDCVARIERSRLTQAKRASAAALMEPEVQQDMVQAVAKAVALQTGEPPDRTPASEVAARESELAISLIEDDEMGRRLHQPSPRQRQPAASPQGEVES
jgi:DNA primase